MPIVLCLGVVVTAVAVAMIASSSAERSKATTQKVKADSLSASEVAVTQIQNLIDRNRLLSMYSFDYWASLNPTASDSQKIAFQSDLEFETANKIKESNNCSNGNAISDTDLNTQIQSRLRTIQAIGSQQWQDLPNGQGSYRLISYQYQGTQGVANGTQTGILTVEGRFGRDNAQSTSRVNVSLPVIQQPVDSIFSTPQIPGLWIEQGATNDLTQTIASNGSYSGGSTFTANVVMSDGCSFTPAQQTSIANFVTTSRITTGSGYQAKFVNEEFPDLPIRPTNVPTAQTNLTITSSQTFPRPGDVATNRTTLGGATVPVYHYIINSIELNGSDRITITPGNRVVFYVLGNIGSNGNSEIVHDCSAAPTGTTCTPTNLQIFAYNTANAAAPQICLKGTSRLDAFIFAPDYLLGKTGNGLYYGSVWGRSWGKISTCGSNNMPQVSVIQRGEWSNLYDDLRPSEPLPKIGSTTAWTEVATDSAVPSPVAITNTSTTTTTTGTTGTTGTTATTTTGTTGTTATTTTGTTGTTTTTTTGTTGTTGTTTTTTTGTTGTNDGNDGNDDHHDDGNDGNDHYPGHENLSKLEMRAVIPVFDRCERAAHPEST
ncbi:hypothetical protein V0288_12595 [Pannus brasiliensis CCIBt3594]|uniref:Uncharacterized protein n=1 Tax=Pannus brasiliensis CCIBt3594 TaxID=1427578 RepID=A0AAW9QSE3_9CHRO